MSFNPFVFQVKFAGVWQSGHKIWLESKSGLEQFQFYFISDSQELIHKRQAKTRRKNSVFSAQRLAGRMGEKFSTKSALKKAGILHKRKIPAI